MKSKAVFQETRMQPKYVKPKQIINSVNHTPTLHGDLSGIVVKYGGCAYEVPKHLN